MRENATCLLADDPLRFSISQFLPCVFSAFLPWAISVISSIDFIATLLANIKNLSAAQQVAAEKGRKMPTKFQPLSRVFHLRFSVFALERRVEDIAA